MRIGIDARLMNETGVGRYIRNLISELSAIDAKHEYVVFLRKPQFDSFRLPNTRWQKVLANVRWHTFSEQIIMPGLFTEAKLDVVHIPYHNPPVLYPGPMVLTIHDLTILHYATGKATTLPMPLYMLKRLGYWAEMAIGLRKAKAILTVSNATKRELMDHFRVPPQKISVTYEGVDARLTKIGRSEGRRITDPYFLYVGNAYPHKNLEFLLRAYKRYTELIKPGTNAKKLVLAGKIDYFYETLQNVTAAMQLTRDVIFYGPANDSELADLYRNTDAFVFPSLMEGFGLPPLEALSLGATVLASNISVHHEILGEHAVYFDTHDTESLAGVLLTARRIADTEKLAERKKFIRTYSWKNLAKETLAVYESCIGV